MSFDTTYYFCNCDEPATEGQNMSINRIFEKHLADVRNTFVRQIVMQLLGSMTNPSNH